MRNLFFLAALAMLLAAGAAGAQSDTTSASKPEPLFKLSANGGWYSRFVVDNGSRAQDEGVVQGNFRAKSRFGVYVDGWASSGGRGESDLTLGLEKGCVDASIAYFEEAGGHPDNVLQFSFKVGCPIQLTERHKLKPYVTFNTVSVLTSEGNSGRFFRIGGVDEYQVNDNLTLNQSMYLLHDSGIFRGDEGLVLRCGASLSRNISGGWSWERGLQVSVPLTVDDQGPNKRDDQVIAIMKFAYTGK